MSDFIAYSENKKVDPCYGLEDFYLTDGDIENLKKGKKLYTTINYGEYAMVLRYQKKREGERMSVISEAEIKSMTKEQNYVRGYKDGKSDVLDKIRTEIAELQKEYKEYGWAYDDALEVIDKYRSEVSE